MLSLSLLLVLMLLLVCVCVFVVVVVVVFIIVSPPFWKERAGLYASCAFVCLSCMRY